MNEEQRNHLLESRFTRPQAIAVAAKNRQLHEPTNPDERLLIVAADHAARGALDVGTNPSAMSNRYDMLDRLVTALAIPGVNGVLGTPDVIEDLLLLGALEKKYVFGSMNRGGLPGAVFEMDDRLSLIHIFKHFDKFLGGSPTNVAVAAARLGQHCALISRTGPDPFGAYVHEALRSFGVDEDVYKRQE